jgi:hypothetical protein
MGDSKDSTPAVDRKSLTFEQAEGAEPLPAQLKPKEISRLLRVRIWRVLHSSMKSHVDAGQFFGDWELIFEDMHVERFGRMSDEFENFPPALMGEVRGILETGDYIKFFGILQWILRHPACPEYLSRELDAVLSNTQAAYRIFDGDTIAPIASQAEAATLQRAFADTKGAEFKGARSHLQKAANELTEGRYADSVRESIHAVESVAELLEPSGELSKALARLASSAGIHGGMKAAFLSLYGYTSNEEGIRHALLEADKASVDEADALFMIGACAAFVSYLINKARKAGLIS